MNFCIVSFPGFYSALVGTPTGGAERQSVLLAKSLAKRGHKVTALLLGYDGPEGNIDDIDVRQAWDPRYGIRGFRFLAYRLPVLRRVLAEICADLYYVRGFSLYAATAVEMAHAGSAVSVVGLAHDGDLSLFRKLEDHQGNPYEALLAGPLAAWYFRKYALMRAKWVGAQSRFQMEQCLHMGLRACYLPNILVAPPAEFAHKMNETDVTFVGAISRRKGINELLELTRILPEVRFRIVGSLQNRQLGDSLDRLRASPNVEWLNGLSHADMLSTMYYSKIVINTSPTEGFSNAILEAWGLGRPVVTLNVDPDNLLSGRNALGACARGDMKEMAELVRRYLSQPDERQRIGQLAKHYALTNHSPEKVCPSYERLAESRLRT